MTKYSRELSVKPSTIKKRSYENFNEANFVDEIKNDSFDFDNTGDKETK